MRRYLLAFIASVMLAGPAVRAYAADTGPIPPKVAVVHKKDCHHCRHVWICGPQGCAWKRVYPRACPDGVSCFSLYGAYGPYGGVAYWGAYTAVGWTGYRW